MSQVDFKSQPRGTSKPRISREEYKEIARQQERAKRLVFRAAGESRIAADTEVGRYVIENTYDGPQPVRARRNGTLIRDGMCKTELSARLAIQEDISRRRKVLTPVFECVSVEELEDEELE